MLVVSRLRKQNLRTLDSGRDRDGKQLLRLIRPEGI